MTCAHCLILTTFAIGVSQGSPQPPPLPALPPAATYALRSHHHYSPSARISNLQLLHPIFMSDLIDKKSKKRQRDRAMFYEPMLPWVETDLKPSACSIENDVSEEKPNFLTHYDDDDDDTRLRKKHHRSSDESLESESVETGPGPIKKIITIQEANKSPEDISESLEASISSQLATMLLPKPRPLLPPKTTYQKHSPYQYQPYSLTSDPSATLTNLQLLSPIFVPDMINKKSKQRLEGKVRLYEYEPMLPLVERESPKLTLDLSVQYDDDDDYNDDSRQRSKHHRTNVESFESESIESEHEAVKRSISIQQALNTEAILEKLKQVCANFSKKGLLSDDDDEESQVKGSVVPGLMWILCKRLLKETGGSSAAVKQALKMYSYGQLESLERKLKE